MVARMPTQSSIRSASAQSIRRRPKKNPDQAKFTTSCATQMPSGRAAPDQPAVRQTIQPETAIMMNSTAQAGPNSQFGGRHQGLRRDSYQAPGLKMAPDAAAAKQAPRKGARLMASSRSMGILPGAAVAGAGGGGHSVPAEVGMGKRR